MRENRSHNLRAQHHVENYNSKNARWDWDKHSDWGGMAPGIEAKIVAWRVIEKAYAEPSVDTVEILWRVWLHRGKRTDDLVMKCIFLVSRWPETVVDSVAEYSVMTELQFMVLLAAVAVGWCMLDARCSNSWMVWMGIAESKGVLKKIGYCFCNPS